MREFHTRIVDTLVGYGCTEVRIVAKGRGHPKVHFVYRCKAYSYVVPGTTGDWNSWRNCISDIKNMAGIVVERRKSTRPKAHKPKRRLPVARPPSLTPGPDMLAPLHRHPLAPIVYRRQLDRAWKAWWCTNFHDATGHRSALA